MVGVLGNNSSGEVLVGRGVVLPANLGLTALGWVCARVLGRVRLKSIVCVLCRMCGGEVIDSWKVYPNGLLAETDSDNLEVS